MGESLKVLGVIKKGDSVASGAHPRRTYKQVSSVAIILPSTLLTFLFHIGPNSCFWPDVTLQTNPHRGDLLFQGILAFQKDF